VVLATGGYDEGLLREADRIRGCSNDMTIAREEIFGPVLCILPYEDEDDAVRIANDTPYGLSGTLHREKSSMHAGCESEFDQATCTLTARGWISVVALWIQAVGATP